jgi:23S rRNA-/tRNA-specific pseudouridylate synthase
MKQTLWHAQRAIKSVQTGTTFTARPFKRKPIPVARQSILYEDHRSLVINKPNNTAIQGQHSTTARKNWDAILAGEPWPPLTTRKGKYAL